MAGPALADCPSSTLEFLSKHDVLLPYWSALQKGGYEELEDLRTLALGLDSNDDLGNYITPKGHQAKLRRELGIQVGGQQTAPVVGIVCNPSHPPPRSVPPPPPPGPLSSTPAPTVRPPKRGRLARLGQAIARPFRSRSTPLRAQIAEPVNLCEFDSAQPPAEMQVPQRRNSTGALRPALNISSKRVNDFAARFPHLARSTICAILSEHQNEHAAEAELMKHPPTGTMLKSGSWAGSYSSSSSSGTAEGSRPMELPPFQGRPRLKPKPTPTPKADTCQKPSTAGDGIETLSAVFPNEDRQYLVQVLASVSGDIKAAANVVLQRTQP
eukprot:NODE_3717_length_1171_cov_58.692748_g3532_i0.p1 GENE.NODE_3717_length_1171_cov_58.692748_g3532_i0~~NODE_3717_length_1171_cov_58.692748_g3532_i0.p1  ORF type:complete len:326 (+),score=16.96 NODE_3717_length_1171_cov_58.692748_g3532_i0:66-1043(+)